ncbi:MAG TPA: FixH family protein [Candidatus Tumulicola sp.]|nr:FixH family protein [Candidatus Tumulicola sp.]
MRNILVAGLMTIFVTACSSSHTAEAPAGMSPVSASGEYTMSLSFDPTPPKQGNETIVIALKDSGGKAVTGAVVKSAAHMPSMGMTGPSMTFQDNGDGTYSAVANLNYKTNWVFDLTATQGANASKAEFKADVH